MRGTYRIRTLGCRVNQAEADGFRTLLGREGYREAGAGEAADVVLVHTCTVTGGADAKSRQLIQRARREDPGAVCVVSGCYAQLHPDAVAALPGVDIVLGTSGRDRLGALLARHRETGGAVRSVVPASRAGAFEELPYGRAVRTRAFIKIQEGCNQYCTYCIIPYARGPVRSRDPQAVLREVEHWGENGCREVVFSGIHTGAYGEDLPGWNLGRLLRAVRRTGIARVRLGSLDPREFNQDLRKEIGAGPPLLGHYHVSLQSGSGGVLDRMRRGYTPEQYRALLGDLRGLVPDGAFTTDVMVGFPGETPQEHGESLAFVREMGFADIHVFPYSARPGTQAASLPDPVPAPVREQRKQDFLRLRAELLSAFLDTQVGREAAVLVEGEKWGPGKRVLWGHSGNGRMVRMVLPAGRGIPETGFRRGEIIEARISGHDGSVLSGDPVIEKDEEEKRDDMHILPDPGGQDPG